MTYALSSTFHRTKIFYPRGSDAMGPMRGIIGWTLISALLFWIPLGFALIR